MALDPRSRFLNLTAMAFFASAVAAIVLFFSPIQREAFFLMLGMAGTLFGMLVLSKAHVAFLKPVCRPKRRFRMSCMLVNAGTYLYSVVNGLLFITMPIYVNGLTHDLFLVGLVVSLPYLAIFVMSFVWGAVTDRIGTRKGVLMWCMLAMGILFLPQPFVGTLGLITVRAIQVFFGSASVLGTALVTEYLPEGKGEAVGEFGMWGATGWLVGGAMSGIVYLYGNVMTLFFLCAIVSIVLAAVMFPIIEISKIKAEFSILSMFRFKRSKEITLICFIIILVYMSNTIVFTLFPVYLKDLSLTEDLIGVLTATGGLMGALLVLGVGRFIDRSGRKMMFIFAIGLYMMDWVVLVLTQNLIVVTIMWAIPIWAFIITSGTAMVSDLTSTEERGRGTGAINSALNMGQFIGALLSGVAAWYMAPILHLGPFRGAYLLAAFLLIPPLLIATRMTETLVLKKKGAGKDGKEMTVSKKSTQHGRA